MVVTGKQPTGQHVFAGWGSDAKAASILNKLLTGEMTVNDLQHHADVADPKAFERAFDKSKIHAAGNAEFRVTQPLKYFKGLCLSASTEN